MPVGSAHMRVTHHPAPSLDAVVDLLEGDPGAAPYSVAWIDCLARGPAHGRGIVMAGRHAEPDEVPGARPFQVPRRSVRRMPVDLPSGILSRRSVGLFNALYQRRNAHARPFLVDYGRYFYPLDGLDDWNRLYGRPGFIQYQFVVPTDGGRKALKRAMVILDAARVPPFLAVLKKLGPESPGPLSFPMPGYTLAVDLPLSAPETLACAARLDDLVASLGGRVYLAKDACLAPKSLDAMYPRLPAWRAVKRKVDPQGRFRSDLAARLGLEAAP
jgi:decaprenylphospho-beta-D-ribofuranose 2-oxidase